MSEMPHEPLTPSQEGFAAMHEVFINLRRAGFSLEEAAAVIAALVKAG